MAAGGQRGIRAGRAYVELGVHDKLAAGLRRAQARLKAFGAAIRNVGLKMAGLGAAMVATLLGSAKSFASMGDNVAKMSQRTGMGVKALSELRFAASQAGTDIQSLEKSLGRMQRSIYDAGRGLSTAVDGFADLGLTFKDLDGLSPEEQFLLIADRLHRIADPTTKAAIAMTLLGRSGTALLPMFAKGAAGIKAYMKEAERLGLTMSEEDAAAAVRLTDAMDKLWKVLKMGVFRTGSALSSLLEELAGKIADVAVTINEWIQANRGIIVSIFKIAAAVLAGGIALVVLGGVISGLGVVMGILATAISSVVAVLGAILSPIGLVITAIAAVGAYILYASGVGGKALKWLGEKFKLLKDTALKAYRGIGDALAAGDISLAAKILWLTLKKAWLEGTESLRKTWAEMWHGIRTVHEHAVHGMTKVFLTAITVWRKAMANVKGFSSDIFTTLKMVIAETGVEITGLLDKSIDVAAAVQQIRLAGAKEFGETDAELQKALTSAEELHHLQMKLADEEHKKNLDDIDEEHVKKIKNINGEITHARKKWQDSLDEAKRRRRDHEEEDDGPGRLESLKELLDRIGNSLGDVAKRTVGVKGTFYATEARGLGAGGASDRIAENTKQTARNTKKLLNKAQRGGLSFG